MGIIRHGAQDEAVEIKYDNTTSGLTSTDVQAAIDEVNAKTTNGEHETSDGSSHTFIDQDVTTTGSPTFSDITTSSINLTTADAGEGNITWNNQLNTLELTMGNGVEHQIGEEIFYPKSTFNNTGSTIPRGTPVMINGGAGDLVYISPAIANGTKDPSLYIGLASEDIVDQSLGRVTYFGNIKLIDTSPWARDTKIYVSATTPGGLTSTRPLSPNFSILVGIVSKQSPTDGVLFARFHNVPNALDIHFDNTESGLVATNVKSALDELESTKASISLLASGIILYTTTANGDFGYKRLVSDIDDPDYNGSAVAFPTGAINTDNQLIGSFISDSGIFVGNPGIISIPSIGNVSKQTGNSNQYAGFYFTISKRTIDGTETVIATSPSTGAINPADTTYRQYSTTALLTNTFWLDTDRIVVKYYADLLGTTGSTYFFEFGGQNPNRLSFPVPVSVIPSTVSTDILVDTSNFNNILGPTDDDVQTALNTLDDHTHIETNDLTTMVTWDIVPNAFISQSSIIQHQAALSITESQISDLGSYLTTVLNTNIDSTGAINGYVLTSDGAGNTIWSAQTNTGVWGSITGTLSAQTDLQTVLNGKMDSISAYTFPTVDGPAGYVMKTDGAGNLTWEADISSGTPSWGTMTGTLSDQTDLQTALDGKMDSTLYTLPNADGPAGYVLKTDGLGNVTWQVDLSAGSPAWGSFGGTLSDQTDLQTALDGKSDTTHNHDGVYEPADSTILKDADIGNETTNPTGTVQPYSSVLANTTAAFTAELETKLLSIEEGATSDYTPVEILSALTTVDGHTLDSSGIDADMLDGQHGDYYLEFSNLTNMPEPFNSALYAFPSDDGTPVSGDTIVPQVLQTDGYGNVTWEDKFDTGWRSDTTDLTVQGNQSSGPRWENMNGAFYGYNFAIGKETYANFNVNHDYKPGSPIHFNIQWTTSGVDTNTVKWQIDYTIAKSYNQATGSELFAPSYQIFLEEPASGTPWRLMVTETSATLDLTNVEPNSLIMLYITRVTNGVSDNGDSVYGLKVGLHYQTDRASTINKAPNFYGV